MKVYDLLMPCGQAHTFTFYQGGAHIGWARVVYDLYMPLGEFYKVNGELFMVHPRTFGAFLAQLWCLRNLRTGLRPRNFPHVLA